MEWIFFSLILFACLRTNYCQEYIMLKQRSVQFPAWVVENIKIKIGLGGLPRNLYSYHCCLAAVCQPSSLQAHQEWQQVTGKLFW